MRMDNRTTIDNIPVYMDEQEIGFADIAEDGTLTFRFKSREPGWRIRYALLNNLAASLTLSMERIPAGLAARIREPKDLTFDPNCNCPWNNGYNLVISGHHIQCTSLKLPHHVDDVCGMTGHLDSKLR